MKRVIEKVAFPTAAAPKLTRVAAYARVSSAKDAMLHSLSAQVSYYNSLIQRHTGWIFCGVYADEGLTGTKVSETAGGLPGREDRYGGNQEYFKIRKKYRHPAGNSPGTEESGSGCLLRGAEYPLNKLRG